MSTWSKSIVYVNWRMFRHLYNIFKSDPLTFSNLFNKFLCVETAHRLEIFFLRLVRRQMKRFVCFLRGDQVTRTTFQFLKKLKKIYNESKIIRRYQISLETLLSLWRYFSHRINLEQLFKEHLSDFFIFKLWFITTHIRIDMLLTLVSQKKGKRWEKMISREPIKLTFVIERRSTFFITSTQMDTIKIICSLLDLEIERSLIASSISINFWSSSNA